MKRGATVLLLAACLLALLGACKRKVTQQECDALLDKFAMLVVRERIKDAPPEMIKAEQERERQEARGDEAFRNCTSEVAEQDYACAMGSGTSEAFLKCLE